MRENEARSIILIPFVIGIFTVILDQWTKHYAVLNLSSMRPSTMIPGFFNLVLVRNPGAAFGMMSGMNPMLRTVLFGIVSLGAVFLLIHIYRGRKTGNLLIPVAIGMVGGGAAGNWIDRLRFGEVIDFLDFYYGTYHWPTFNFADTCISTGVALLLIHMFLDDRRGDSNAS